MHSLKDWIHLVHNQSKKKPRVHYYTQRFQLRDALWLAMIGLFCFALMAFLLYLALFHTAESAPDPSAARAIVEQTFATRRILTYFEVSVPLFVFTAFLLSIGIVASHRTAGPVFAIKRHMNRVRVHGVRYPLALRSKDEFQDVAYVLNAMLATFWEREDGVSEQLLLACEALDKNDVHTALALLERIRTDLQPAKDDQEPAKAA